MTSATVIENARTTSESKRALVHGRIDQIESLGPSVTMLKIRVESDRVFAWTPGQYIEVLGDDGRFRCFSLARPNAADGCIELHVARVPNGAFSDHAVRRLRPGDPISWRGPFGEFGWRRDALAKHAIFMCTGTGFAPVMAIVDALLSEPPVSMPISIYWGGRSLADLYLMDIAREWARLHSHVRFVPVMSRCADGIDGARLGYVQHAVVEDFDSLADAAVYACGSPAMVANARDTLTATRGLRHDAFFADPFGTLYIPASATLNDCVQVLANGAAYSVSTDQTLLAALRGAGVAMQSVCGGRGACGTCVVEVDDASHARLVPAGRDERDLLECLPNVTSRSRLACQIKIDRSADGLAVSI